MFKERKPSNDALHCTPDSHNSLNVKRKRKQCLFIRRAIIEMQGSSTGINQPTLITYLETFIPWNNLGELTNSKNTLLKNRLLY
jgi:hypothetical protein